jgi:hypothetical protein
VPALIDGKMHARDSRKRSRRTGTAASRSTNFFISNIPKTPHPYLINRAQSQLASRFARGTATGGFRPYSTIGSRS